MSQWSPVQLTGHSYLTLGMTPDVALQPDDVLNHNRLSRGGGKGGAGTLSKVCFFEQGLKWGNVGDDQAQPESRVKCIISLESVQLCKRPRSIDIWWQFVLTISGSDSCVA